METIFTERDSVISSFITPWILGYGCKTPEEAKKYIKFGETLNPFYYLGNKKCINDNGAESVYLRFMHKLFNENNINHNLTQIIGENVYKPWDCLSGIYQVEINKKMGLVARINGITKNNECVVMVDNYFNKTKFYRNTEKEIEIKLLSTMAVWKAKKGVYIIKKMNNKQISIDFDNTKWEDILCKIKSWAESVFIPNRNSMELTQLGNSIFDDEKDISTHPYYLLVVFGLRKRVIKYFKVYDNKEQVYDYYNHIFNKKKMTDFCGNIAIEDGEYICSGFGEKYGAVYLFRINVKSDNIWIGYTKKGSVYSAIISCHELNKKVYDITYNDEFMWNDFIKLSYK